MPQILRTTLIRDAVPAADGVANYDLPVNPLSAILLTVKALNATTALADYSAIAALLAMITNVTVTYRGANIVNASLTDLAVLGSLLSKWGPHQANQEEADDDVRSITVPILFGRRPYDPAECFPATRRGDLILSLTEDVAVTGADGLIVQAETVELLDATPSRFLKKTTISKVNAAAGIHEIDLPISNDLLGALLWAPVVPTGASYNSNFGQVALQVDNVETIFSQTNWESLAGELNRKLGPWPQQPHVHGYDGITVGVAGSVREQQTDFNLLNNYGYLDFDPLEDDQYLLKTAGAARVNLSVTDDAGSATAVRVLPIEMVRLAAAAA